MENFYGRKNPRRKEGIAYNWRIDQRQHREDGFFKLYGGWSVALVTDATRNDVLNAFERWKNNHGIIKDG